MNHERDGIPSIGARARQASGRLLAAEREAEAMLTTSTPWTRPTRGWARCRGCGRHAPWGSALPPDWLDLATRHSPSCPVAGLPEKLAERRRLRGEPESPAPRRRRG